MEYSHPIPFQSLRDESPYRRRQRCLDRHGYASTYEKDLGGDVVVPGAFRKSLAEYGMPALCWNHDFTGVPLGNVVACEERSKGLWFKSELPKDDSLVAQIIPKMKRGDLKGISIGYKAIEKETRRSDGARLLKKITLVEISFCPRPMNVQAQIESVKSFNPDRLDVVERALEEATREMQSLARRVRGR